MRHAIMMHPSGGAPVRPTSSPPAPHRSSPHAAWRDPNIVILCIAGAAFIGLLALPYGGFCLNTFRFLSDEQAIDAAIHYVSKLRTHSVETPRGDYTTFIPERQVSYVNSDEFR